MATNTRAVRIKPLEIEYKPSAVSIGGASKIVSRLPIAAAPASVRRLSIRLGKELAGVKHVLEVGSRADFEAMNAFIAEHEIHPIIDRVFEFEQAPAAFEFMANGDYMGKIVIRL